MRALGGGIPCNFYALRAAKELLTSRWQAERGWGLDNIGGSRREPSSWLVPSKGQVQTQIMIWCARQQSMGHLQGGAKAVLVEFFQDPVSLRIGRAMGRGLRGLVSTLLG